MKRDFTIRICGGAGDGSLAAGQILNRAAALMGLHIMNYDSYPAEIRGFGKSTAHTRISPASVLSPGERADCLVALHDRHAAEEISSLQPRGVLIYDSSQGNEGSKKAAGLLKTGMKGCGVPLKTLSIEATQGTQGRNIAALGVITHLFGFSREAFAKAIQSRFADKSEAVRQSARAAFDAGYQYAKKHLAKRDTVCFEKEKVSPRKGIEILSGNEAAARACLDANVGFFAGYPITPATKILEVLAKELPPKGGVVLQAEDEISALGHVIGAGFAGKRSATATSGPGLALMVEFLNLGVMAEVPFVVIDCQRGGPSTGIPTKTEQSDLFLAVFGGSGDSPRPVLAPVDVGECYSLTKKAFEVAEGLQTPVVVLMDAFLANRMEDLVLKDLNPEYFGKFEHRLARAGQKSYRRYAWTKDGVSPRAWPGMEGRLHIATGLEHDEQSRPNYDALVHEQMSEKRRLKMEKLLSNWVQPEIVGGRGKFDCGIISWGSSVGAVREVVDALRRRGLAVGGFFPRLLWPAHTESLRRFSKRCRQILVVEMNYSGQYASIVEGVVHREVHRLSHVYTTPFPASVISETVEKIKEKVRADTG